MFPNSILGFQRRESDHEDQDREEAEADFSDRHRNGVSVLASCSSSAVSGPLKWRDHEKQVQMQEEKAGGSESLLDENNISLARIKIGRIGFVSGKRKAEDVGSEVLEQHRLGIPARECCAIWQSQRREGRGKQKAVEEQEEIELDQEHHNGILSSAIANRVNFQGKKDRKDIEDGRAVEMETRWKALPEELVEIVISMMPFPDILKARVLNKSWHSNFTASSGASGLQNQVKSVSSSWKHYCPIILNIEEEWLLGFDPEYNQWQKMAMRFERGVLSNWFSTNKFRGAGCLMCGIYRQSQIFITNVLTRTWRWLPPQPEMGQPKEMHLLLVGSDAYQVLLVTKHDDRDAEVCCQLYDSRTQSWTLKKSVVNTVLFHSSSAYLDGVMYVMEYDSYDFNGDIMKLLAYNVENGTWTNIPHPFGYILHEIESYELLVCQSHIMVVLRLLPTWWTTVSIVSTPRNTLMVYMLDPISLDLREVSRGPPEPVTGASSTLFASDDECIYFGDPQSESSVIVLNVQDREWSSLPPPSRIDGSFKNKWATFSFRPGLNPFVTV